MAPPSGRRTRSLTIVRAAPALRPTEPAMAWKRLLAWRRLRSGAMTTPTMSGPPSRDRTRWSEFPARKAAAVASAARDTADTARDNTCSHPGPRRSRDGVALTLRRVFCHAATPWVRGVVRTTGGGRGPLELLQPVLDVVDGGGQTGAFGDLGDGGRQGRPHGHDLHRDVAGQGTGPALLGSAPAAGLHLLGDEQDQDGDDDEPADDRGHRRVRRR
jgi:hypothetical protein